MAGIHDLTVAELEAATRALTRETNELGALAQRFEDKGDVNAAYQLRLEENAISVVSGVLLRAIRNRKNEDRERAYLLSDGKRIAADEAYIATLDTTGEKS